MDAYTLVDGTTRRNMEGMLKTWKEPVPGALDSTPVFPPDIVRPIENALIKYRTVMVQNSRQVQNHPQIQQPAYRNTPTPPQINGRFGARPGQSNAQPYYGQSVQQVRPF
jgi:pre-mRNA cleavage complex 2 protein Pcf11